LLETARNAMSEFDSQKPAEEIRKPVPGDNPVRDVADDSLGRAHSAQAFGRQVLDQDASAGVVVGILGPWGSGKTSFFNLARPVFESAGVPILEFNPWMFSGAQQLVESFFTELGAQLRLRPGLATLGNDLADYGEMFSGLGWLPIVGSWIERLRFVTRIVGEVSKRRKEGIGARRDKIEKALSKLPKPIVIFLDDIDRLPTAEIRDVFKLVRLTASFPNLIYVLAFDRLRVEQALIDQGIPGRDYLEKILQVAVDLPAVPDQTLGKQAAYSIDAALAGLEHPGPFDGQVWPDVFMEIIRPLIRNMRDVRRFAAAVRGTVSALDGEIALADVLGLEAVRIFLPDVFAKIYKAVAALTTTEGHGSGRRDSPDKDQVNDIVKTGGAHEVVVRAMIERLFPAARKHMGGSHYTRDWEQEWLKKRRVAHEHILRLYLERIVGEELGDFLYAEKAYGHLGDRKALDKFLRSLNMERIRSIVASLEAYENEFRPEHVVPATIVLLNLSADIPERERGMFELGNRFVVGRVTLRLLRVPKDPAAVQADLRQILPELNSLSLKLELILQVGHQKNIGHKLVSEADAAELEKSWRGEVRKSTAEELLEERDIGAILLETKRRADSSEAPLHIPNTPEFTLALLRCARGETLSQYAGNRGVRRHSRLAWDALIETYGDESILRERIEALRKAQLEGVGDLLELSDKYLAGWRPGIFNDE
jgi:hypothetical protein